VAKKYAWPRQAHMLVTTTRQTDRMHVATQSVHAVKPAHARFKDANRTFIWRRDTYMQPRKAHMQLKTRKHRLAAYM
jgi:hypothetical protein